jgi:hypothetical protein
LCRIGFRLTPAQSGSGSREGQEGFADGGGAEARFWFPTGIALDTAGDLIVADYGNHCIRKVRVLDGHVSTVAGSSSGGDAAKGFADGLATAARFHNPRHAPLARSLALFSCSRLLSVLHPHCQALVSVRCVRERVVRDTRVA